VCLNPFVNLGISAGFIDYTFSSAWAPCWSAYKSSKSFILCFDQY